MQYADKWCATVLGVKRNSPSALHLNRPDLGGSLGIALLFPLPLSLLLNYHSGPFQKQNVITIRPVIMDHFNSPIATAEIRVTSLIIQILLQILNFLKNRSFFHCAVQ